MGIWNSLHHRLDPATGIIRGVFLAGEVFHPGERAFHVLSGGDGVVALREVGERFVVMVHHGVSQSLVTLAATPCGSELAVVILLRADAVGAVIGVGDALGLGVGGFGKVRGVVVKVLRATVPS